MEKNLRLTSFVMKKMKKWLKQEKRLKKAVESHLILHQQLLVVETKKADAKGGDAKGGDAKAGDAKKGDAKAKDAKADDKAKKLRRRLIYVLEKTAE